MINIIPVKALRIIKPSDNLISVLKESLTDLINKDVIIISSKVVAITEGRTYELHTITPSEEAELIANKYSMDSRLVQLIIENSDKIIGGVKGVLLTMVNNNLVANAGIDKSNCGVGRVVAWPINPYYSARMIRNELLDYYSLDDLGVIISDSHVTSLRQGVIGQAIGVAGINPVEDLRGKKDLFGYTLTYSKRAIADQLVTAAHLVAGESDEMIPFVIIRGFNGEFTNEDINHSSIYMPFNKCLIVNSIKEYFNDFKKY